MNNQSQILDSFITILKTKFSRFEYTNVIKDSFYEKKLLNDEFAIIVRGVPRSRIKEVRKFIREEIYSKCADDELLPDIILLQNLSKKCNWAEEYEIEPLKELKEAFNYAAEDFTYLRAA